MTFKLRHCPMNGAGTHWLSTRTSLASQDWSGSTARLEKMLDVTLSLTVELGASEHVGEGDQRGVDGQDWVSSFPYVQKSVTEDRHPVLVFVVSS